MEVRATDHETPFSVILFSGACRVASNGLIIAKPCHAGFFFFISEYPLGMAGLRYTIKVSVCTGGERSVRAQPDNVSAEIHPKKMSSCGTHANKHMQTNRNISHQLTYLPVSYFKTRNISESWKKKLKTA